ncbi:MAG: serine hydrolase domain-containing protein [Phycisphaerales bacterium]|jgi:CubicO group peptidase (beta-lactamase class C family)
MKRASSTRLRRLLLALAPLLVPLLTLAPPAGAQAQKPQASPTPAPHDPADISSLLDPIAKKHDVPALAAVVVRGDGTIEMRGVAGVREAGKPAKVTIDDLFHLGSCTKAMTATLCAILVQDGTLTWDTALESVFPDDFARAGEPAGETKPANPAWKKVTLLDLLTHRSGMPTDLSKDRLWLRLWQFKGEPQEARELLLQGVLGYTPDSPPGTKFEYSNAGFAVAGHMAEVKAGEAWETLIQRKLFTPLGITSAGFGAPDGDDQPRGHQSDGTPVEPGPAADNPVAISPAGRVHMTLADWSKFVALHLRGAEGRLLASDPIKQDAFKTLHTPFPTDAAQPDDGYACGWIVTKRPWAAAKPGGSQRVLTHNGTNTMWHCVVWMAPDRDFAVLVACNRGGSAGAKATDEAAAQLIAEFGKRARAK